MRHSGGRLEWQPAGGGTGGHLVMPVDAARTLSDLAEVINQI